jgi:hypothetical protein
MHQLRDEFIISAESVEIVHAVKVEAEAKFRDGGWGPA